MLILAGVVVLGAILALMWLVRQYSGSPPKTVQHETNEAGERVSFRADVDTHKGKNRGYRLGITALSGFTFAIRDESAFDRFGKSLGVTAEQETGDRRFDSTFFIDSNDLRVGRALRHAPEARAAMERIRAVANSSGGSFLRVQAAGGNFWLTVSGNVGLPDSRDQATLAEALKTIAGAIAARLSDAAGEGGRDPFRRRAIGVVTISSGLLVFGLVALVRLPAARLDLDAGDLWWWSAVAGASATLASAVLVMRWLHASSRAHYVLLEWLTVGLAGMILTMHAFAIEVNRDFDRAEATVVGPFEARLVKETYRCGKRRRNTCTRYEFRMAPGAIPGFAGDLRVDSLMYQRLQRDTWFTARIRPGLLGCRWIESIDPAKPPSPE